jgi:hypothetical protein
MASYDTHQQGYDAYGEQYHDGSHYDEQNQYLPEQYGHHQYYNAPDAYHSGGHDHYGSQGDGQHYDDSHNQQYQDQSYGHNGYGDQGAHHSNQYHDPSQYHWEDHQDAGYDQHFGGQYPHSSEEGQHIDHDGQYGDGYYEGHQGHYHGSGTDQDYHHQGQGYEEQHPQEGHDDMSGGYGHDPSTEQHDLYGNPPPQSHDPSTASADKSQGTHTTPAASEKHDLHQAPGAHHDDSHPDSNHSSAPHSTPGGPTLNVALENTFETDEKVYAYVIGHAMEQGNKLLIMSSDGKTPLYPSTAGPLTEHCAIELEKSSPTTVTIPHIAGGRIYFSLKEELHFSIGDGSALVEPSVTNSSDPNYNVEWGFVELTFNTDQVYANISYVDFVSSIPLGLSLETQSGGTQHVSGMTAEGLHHVCDGLTQQSQHDGLDWHKLVVSGHDSQPLRVLSLNQAVIADHSLFSGYYDHYIEQVWSHLSSASISVDTQAAAGIVTGKVHDDTLHIGNAQLHKPTTIDVLTCNSGPFATGSDPETNAIIPRVAAAFNRSTLMTTDHFPEDKELFYQADVTNHYARVVHEANVDGKGYAFPYDDVQKTGGVDQSGEVHAGSADVTLLTVLVGGGRAHEVGGQDGGHEQGH